MLKKLKIYHTGYKIKSMSLPTYSAIIREVIAHVFMCRNIPI